MTLATSCQVASFQIFSFRLRPKTDRGSSGANRGRKGGRERADDDLLFHRNKRTPEQSELCSDVARGFNLIFRFPTRIPTRTGIQRSESGSEAKKFPVRLRSLAVRRGFVPSREFLSWCGRRDSNPHTTEVTEPKSVESTNSTTPAYSVLYGSRKS